MVLFFFSSRRRHTRYWRDWSSDVCSSDLSGEDVDAAVAGDRVDGPRVEVVAPEMAERRLEPIRGDRAATRGDRKRVGEGKSVDLGGRRIIKKNSLHFSLTQHYIFSMRQET